MLRKPQLIPILVIALVALAILALPERTRSRVRIALGSLFLPLFGLAGSAQAAAERASQALTPRASLATRIRTLEEENRGLRMALAEAQTLVNENARLRDMLGAPVRRNWRLKSARVIGRDPVNWWQSVHIDIGLHHGATTNLPVLTAEGLVGRIVECAALTSRVVLVGDPNCPVAAALADTGETGIIRGASGGDIQAALVDLSYLSRNAVVRPGQRVVTSGQGGVFPAGIIVGDSWDGGARRSEGGGWRFSSRDNCRRHRGRADRRRRCVS